MPNTVTYLIIISKTTSGYKAVIPAFPDLTTEARGARAAYTQLKDLIQERIRKLFADGKAAPREPVIQTRTLRLDLEYLREQEELR